MSSSNTAPTNGTSPPAATSAPPATSAPGATAAAAPSALGRTTSFTASAVFFGLACLVAYVCLRRMRARLGRGGRRRTASSGNGARGGDDVEAGAPPPRPARQYPHLQPVAQPVWGGNLAPGAGPAHAQPVAMQITTAQGVPGVVYAYPMHRNAVSALVAPAAPPPAAASAASPGGEAAPRPRFDVSTLHSFDVAEKNRDEACPICLGPLHEEKVSLGPCLHIAHTSCLQSWLLKDKECSCPICREPFVEQPGASAELSAAIGDASASFPVAANGTAQSRPPATSPHAAPNPVEPFPQQFNPSIRASPPDLPAGAPVAPPVAGTPLVSNQIASLYPASSSQLAATNTEL